MCAPNTLVNEDKQSVNFIEKTVSMSAGRFIANMAGLAFFVFLATSHFYAPSRESSQMMVPVVDNAATAKMEPMHAVAVREHSPNHTSRGMVVKSASGSSTGDATKNVEHDTEETRGLSINMGSVASEVGIVVALQAIFPVLNRVILVAKRIKWASLGVRVSPGIGRILKTFSNIWHTLMMGYKKTSASKIVTRTKKMVKIYKHSDDHHHDDHGGHDEGHAGRHRHKTKAQRA